MIEGRTVPHDVRTLPVRTLRAEVVEGPDSGKSRRADSDTITVGTAPGNDLVLTDETVSRHHVELRREHGRILVMDHGSTNGVQVGNVTLARGVVTPGTVLSLGKSKVRVDDGDTVECELLEHDHLGGIRGRTSEMRRLMASVTRAARSDVSVLLLGETGTGKEVFARAIHEVSPRTTGPFETVDCASLLPTLVASELFGHERGAFTGADDRHVGAFERAHGGTLFLDEIGELPLTLQASLLGALERRSFRRLGGAQAIDVDVRLICATNRELRADVNQSRFREDLYYRVAVVLFRLPPLRERLEDIPLLIESFAKEVGYEGPVESVISARVQESLRAHHWPGNVRELRNFVEAAIAMGEAQPVDASARPAGSGERRRPSSVSAGESSFRLELGELRELDYKNARDSVVRAFEADYLARLLERTRGNVARAAREADMDRTYLTQLLKRHGLR